METDKEYYGNQIPPGPLKSSKVVMTISNNSQTSGSCSGLINDALAPQAFKNDGKKVVKVPKSSDTWSSEEDEVLLHIVRTMESPKWEVVAQHFYRHHWACQKRYEKLMRRRKTP